MFKHRRPAWWLLWALVPLLAGLFVLEHRALLSPGGHKGVQVGIVLAIYGLVWLWLRGNAARLLWSDQGTRDKERSMVARGAGGRSPWPRFTPRQAHVIHRISRHRRVNLQVNGRGIKKCSVNFARRSSY